jgi:hypothetical protein
MLGRLVANELVALIARQGDRPGLEPFRKQGIWAFRDEFARDSLRGAAFSYESVVQFTRHGD